MKNTIRYIEHFLRQTVYLLPYLLMGVSFLSIIIPCLGYNFDYITWGNGGGFSIITDVMFITFLSFDKRYCKLTRILPFGLLFINIINIVSHEFYPEQHEIYSKWYEVIIFSVILFIALILCITKRINK